MADDRYELHGVEIFRAGTWNGDKYTVEDLDEMVANFGNVGYDVPVKLGHAEDEGEPAYGWVARIFRLGDKIVADFRDLPGKIFEAIRNRRFDAISSELYLDLKRNGQTFRRALKAVALLGAQTPAVAGLKPLRDSLRGFADEAEWSAVKMYTLKEEKPDMSETNLKATAKALGLAENATQAEIDAKIAELSQATTKVAELTTQLEAAKASGVETKNLTDQIADLTKRLSEGEAREREATIRDKVESLTLPAFRDHFRSLYTLALADATPKTVKFSFKGKDGVVESRDDSPVKVLDDLVARLNGNVGKLFGEVSDHVGGGEGNAPTDKPGEEVDRLARLAMTKNSKLSYGEATRAVLADPENAELKEAFARLG